MVKFFRQTWALTKKTLRIAAIRFWFTTCIRAFVLPVVFMAFLAFARNLFIPPAVFGVGTPAPINQLIDEVGGMRLVLIKNGLTRDVQQVVDTVSNPLFAAGKDVLVLENDSQLGVVCKQSLRGVSGCYAVAIFSSSPDNPNPEVSGSNAAIWNYTLRADSSLGRRIDVEKHDNEIQQRLFPLQHAIDFAIANTKPTSRLGLPGSNPPEGPSKTTT
jgi:ATP-binding cassette, subfamily A (ABC1), member 3